MQKLRLGIFGLGTVGTGVLEQIVKQKDKISSQIGVEFIPYKAVVNNAAKKRNLPVDIPVSDDPDFILGDDQVDIYLELAGGKELPAKIVAGSLKRGIPLITANKQYLAENGSDIFSVTEEQGLFLGYEASVCGGIPVIKTVSESLAGDNIRSIRGILNGTANYILTRMSEDNMEFAQALELAKAKGYAEADPTFDVEGIDAAHKLMILMRLAFGGIFDFSELSIEGISGIEKIDIQSAKELGYTLKMIGEANLTEGEVEAFVRPVLIPSDHPLAKINNNLNAVSILSDFIGETIMTGPGAGGHPTANSVISDLVDYVLNRSRHKFGSHLNRILPPEQERTQYEFYVHLPVEDRLGVLRETAGMFSDHGISISRMIQKSPDSSDGNIVDLIFITHKTCELQVSKAMKSLFASGFVVGKGKFLRIIE